MPITPDRLKSPATDGHNYLDSPRVTTASAAQPGRVPELDGLRGLAILLVLLCHYVGQQVHSTPHTLSSYFAIAMNFGWVGVDLFFVLSGFLIGGILIDHRSSPHFYKTFYMRRICRIFPLYYAWLGISLLLLGSGMPGHIVKLMKPDIPFWSYFTYTQNIVQLPLGEFGNPWYGVTWSLAVEEQFYLLFPFLIRLSSPAKLPIWLLSLAAVAVGFRMLAFSFLPAAGFAGYVLLPCRWDALLLGVLAAWASRQQGFVEIIRRYERFALITGVLIISAIVGLRAAHQGDLRSPGMQLLGFPLLAVFFSGMLLLAMYSRLQVLRQVFRIDILRWLGGISYGVYLLHQPVSWSVHEVLWGQRPKMDSFPTAMTTLLALGLTLAIASLSWRYYEAKWLVWGRRYVY